MIYTLMNDQEPLLPIDPPSHIEPFDVPTTTIVKSESSLPVTAQDSKMDHDFEYVRNNLKDLVETGSSALSSLFDLAQQSENARAYEVLSITIKTLSEINKDLLDIHEKKAKVEAASNKASGQPVGVTNNVQNNVVFTGTTAELNGVIERLQKNKSLL